jgi:hypothetical protein
MAGKRDVSNKNIVTQDKNERKGRLGKAFRRHCGENFRKSTTASTSLHEKGSVVFEQCFHAGIELFH